MTLPVYLAMTALEMELCRQLPAPMAYMACHFSPYSTGISNMPRQLPRGSMVILNDRIPVFHHDPQRVAQQLEQLCTQTEAACLLLDLQRPGESLTMKIVSAVLAKMPCPVGVSEHYAKDTDAPVFLSAPPLHCPLAEHLAPWQGRSIWLEAAPDSCRCTVTETDDRIEPCDAPDAPLLCPELYCHYGIRETDSAAIFTLERRLDDLKALLKEAQQLGITCAVGLYQQLGSAFL